MIVAVLAARDGDEVRALLADLERRRLVGAVVAEIRLDLLADPEAGLTAGGTIPILATCRRVQDGGGWTGGEDARRALLRRAFEAGASVDLESDVLHDVAWARGERVVASFHDFLGTPDHLPEIVAHARATNPSGRVKLAVRPHDLTDLLRLRRITSAGRETRITAFGLGPTGVCSRWLFRRFGSERVYASMGSLRSGVAPGLPTLDALTSSIYSDERLSEPVAVFGVLGDRACESIGPRVFHRVFQRHRVRALYVPLTVPRLTGLREFWKALGLRGLSVTTPFKEQVVHFADARHPLVDRIGAANTLVQEGTEVRAYNTDYHGVLEPLRPLVPSLRSREALVLGVGGAGRAAAVAAADLGLSVSLWSRQRRRAEEAALRLGVRVADLGTGPAPGVVIQATPAGGPRDPEGCPLPASWMAEGQVILEMNYWPRETPLMAAGREVGARVLDGSVMYAAQAAHQLHLFWTGLPDLASEVEEAVSWALTEPASF